MINTPPLTSSAPRNRVHQPQNDAASSSVSTSRLQRQVAAVASTSACIEVHCPRHCHQNSSAGAASRSSLGRIVPAAGSSASPIAGTSAAAIRQDLEDAQQRNAAFLSSRPSEILLHPHDDPEAPSNMEQFEIEEVAPSLDPAARISSAVLGNFLRVGLSTGAGRLASWAALKMMPDDLDLAAYGVASVGSVLRHYGAINLCYGAAQTIASPALRRTAIAGTALAAGTMLAPVALLLLHPENKRLANTIALQNIADFTYAAIRDPLQNALRNVGPRITLPSPDRWNQPDWRAMSIVGGAYAMSTLGWLSLFDHIGPAGCGDSPSCSALDTIGSTVAIEASEAIAMACIYSFFRDAIFQQDFSPQLPQRTATLINMSMRVFATGLMRLLEIWRQEPDGPSNVEHAILLVLMMFSLEMTSGLAQRTIARLSTAGSDDDEDGASIATDSTGADEHNAFQEQA